MKKIFDFGKIAFSNPNRRANRVEVAVELRRDELSRPRFSAAATIYSQDNHSTVAGGQCLDELYPLFKSNTQFREIYWLWKNYHLNDMHAGTPEQEAFLVAHPEADTFDAQCEALAGVGLLDVVYAGKSYRYGSSWLYREIPAADLEKIEKLLAQ